MNCLECGQAIPTARLRALPDTLCCVACSQVSYTRPAATVFPQGAHRLLADATEAPIQRELAPEQKATERAEASFYRTIESLDEIDT